MWAGPPWTSRTATGRESRGSLAGGTERSINILEMGFDLDGTVPNPYNMGWRVIAAGVAATPPVIFENQENQNEQAEVLRPALRGASSAAEEVVAWEFATGYTSTRANVGDGTGSRGVGRAGWLAPSPLAMRLPG